MRGGDLDSGSLFSYVDLEKRAPTGHPLRIIRRLVDSDFNLLYRWFVGLSIDDGVWDATVYRKNRDRLLNAGISHKFPHGIITHKRVRCLLSKDHFSADGILIDAWALMKSFVPKDRDHHDDGDMPGGRNTQRDFPGAKRRNDTHAGTTDPRARFYRKGRGKSAHLCFMAMR